MQQQPLPTLEKLALVTDDEETAPGTGSRKTKRKKRTVYKPRTNFTNAIRKVRGMAFSSSAKYFFGS